jgi:DNA-binding transcriptional ArsR family regulator
MVPYLAAMNDDLVFRALADASRRRLLDRLHMKNGQTLGELCDGEAMTRQAVAKHLGILEAANLVSSRRQGREKLHFINPVPIHGIAERWIRKFEMERLGALSDLKRTLETKDHDQPE